MGPSCFANAYYLVLEVLARTLTLGFRLGLVPFNWRIFRSCPYSIARSFDVTLICVGGLSMTYAALEREPAAVDTLISLSCRV